MDSVLTQVEVSYDVMLEDTFQIFLKIYYSFFAFIYFTCEEIYLTLNVRNYYSTALSTK